MPSSDEQDILPDSDAITMMKSTYIIRLLKESRHPCIAGEGDGISRKNYELFAMLEVKMTYTSHLRGRFSTQRYQYQYKTRRVHVKIR